MSEIDQQFIEYVVKSLVGKPDAVHIDRRIDEKGVLLELTVDPEDLGRVIGKRGATAQSLRTLLRALGTKNDARYNLKIVDNGVGSHDHQGSTNDDSSAVTTSDDSTTKPDPVDNSKAEPAEPLDVEETDANEEPEEVQDEASDRLKQTREELADLDDLDI
jgi:predicted RNA-binding protein YlqC (UPF0109 family)